MQDIQYIQCDECGHMFEVVFSGGEPTADGYEYDDSDSFGWAWNDLPHGTAECAATLIVRK